MTGAEPPRHPRQRYLLTVKGQMIVRCKTNLFDIYMPNVHHGVKCLSLTLIAKKISKTIPHTKKNNYICNQNIAWSFARRKIIGANKLKFNNKRKKQEKDITNNWHINIAASDYHCGVPRSVSVGNLKILNITTSMMVGFSVYKR